jgi:hypothetical protein
VTFEEFVNGYGIVSLLATLGGAGAWFASWQRTSPRLWHRKMLEERSPRTLEAFMRAQRVGKLVTIIGGMNLLVALFVAVATSSS